MLLRIAKAFLLIGVFGALVGVSVGETHMPFSEKGAAPDFAPGQVILKLRPGHTESDLNSIKEEYQISRFKKDRVDESLFLVYVPTYRDIPDLVQELGVLPIVDYVSPNYLYYATFTPDDTYFNDPIFYQWALMQPDDKDIDADSAWDISRGSPAVKIGIIDTGVDRDHPDLVDNLLDGYDFVDYEQYPPGMWEFVGDYQTEDDDPTDDYGHGTHVSGIASAKGNNGRGIAGVNWNSKIVPLRAGVTRKNNWFYYYEGVFSAFDIRDAINYAVGEGCKVINMSLGGRWPDTLIHNAIINAYNAGCVLVASSGNNSSDQISYPAAWPEVIAVGATERTDLKADYSNYGEALDVAAPGGKYDPYSVDADYIISTAPCYWVYMCVRVLGFCYDPQDPENYSLLSGTSMAAPHVSGLAALILTVNPNLTPAEVKGIIENSAEKVGGYYYDPVTGKSQELGHGRINAYYALRAFEERDEFGADPTTQLSWGDYDADGDLDVAVADPATSNKLYENDYPAPTFTERSEFSASAPTWDITWGDYDNDGDLDVALANNGANNLHKNNGDGSFTGFEKFGVSDSRGCTWGDYDNDGDLDLAVANRTSTDKLYRNELYSSTGISYPDSFTEFDPFAGYGTFALAWADYDNDGDLDLVSHTVGLPLKLYRNNGDGTFSELDVSSDPHAAVFSFTWGDYDNDSDLDLAAATDEGDIVYVNDYPDVTFTQLDDLSGRYSNAIQWGDADNDGDLDLVAGIWGRNKLYMNNASDLFGQMPLGSGTDDTEGVSWGDFDCDGDLDIACANAYDTEQNKLYINKATNNDYIKVQLTGRRRELANPGYSNRDGIGARVKVFDEPGVTLLGFREISSHSGAALEAHFGVPEGNTYNVKVFWPTSGITMDTVVIAPAVITVWEYCRGDANGDRIVDVGDITFLVSYLYSGGPAPDPLSSGDANADGIVNVGDVTFLVSYLYKGGPPPAPPSCP